MSQAAKLLEKLVVIACGIFLGMSQAQADSACLTAIAVPRAGSNKIQADASQNARTLEPSFFGFNLEWLEFQLGVWDGATRNVLPGVTDIFRKFPAAVYRFPGGTNANHLDWLDAAGPAPARPPRKQVSWLEPVRAEFGVDEYLRFVKDVGGQAWYVTNLNGSLDAATAPAQLASSAGQLAAFMHQRVREGFPPVLRWELGNELDRAQHKWPPEKLANVALQVADAIARNTPNARFVHLQQEYPAQADKGFSAARYNKELRAPLAKLAPEFALHFYYDGPPDAPPVDYFLKQLCQVVDGAQTEGSPGNIWVTEHGRVPNGFWAKTPKELWPATANLEAAISLADMLIALARVPQVQGAFTHALVASGSPWPLLHRRSNGMVEPSTTLLGMTVLRQSMLPGVLPATQTAEGNGTLGARYAVRSTVLADAARKNFTVWSVNRSPAPQTLEFELKNAATPVQYQDGNSLSDAQVNASNYLSGSRLVIASNQVKVITKGDTSWMIQLPPNSVSALRFAAVK